MAIYKVFYSSMFATYGPRFIVSDSPQEAKREFGRLGGFGDGGQGFCMTAREVSPSEMRAALKALGTKES